MASSESNNYGHLVEHNTAENMLVELLRLRPENPKERAHAVKSVLRDFFEQYEQREHYFAHIVRQKDLEIEMHYSRAAMATKFARRAEAERNLMTDVTHGALNRVVKTRHLTTSLQRLVRILAHMLVTGTDKDIPDEFMVLDPTTKDAPVTGPLKQVISFYKDKQVVPDMLEALIPRLSPEDAIASTDGEPQSDDQANTANDKERLFTRLPIRGRPSATDIAAVNREVLAAYEVVNEYRHSLTGIEEEDAFQNLVRPTYTALENLRRSVGSVIKGNVQMWDLVVRDLDLSPAENLSKSANEANNDAQCEIQAYRRQIETMRHIITALREELEELENMQRDTTFLLERVRWRTAKYSGKEEESKQPSMPLRAPTSIDIATILTGAECDRSEAHAKARKLEQELANAQSKIERLDSLSRALSTERRKLEEELAGSQKMAADINTKIKHLSNTPQQHVSQSGALSLKDTLSDLDKSVDHLMKEDPTTRERGQKGKESTANAGATSSGVSTDSAKFAQALEKVLGNMLKSLEPYAPPETHAALSDARAQMVATMVSQVKEVMAQDGDTSVDALRETATAESPVLRAADNTESKETSNGSASKPDLGTGAGSQVKNAASSEVSKSTNLNRDAPNVTAPGGQSYATVSPVRSEGASAAIPPATNESSAEAPKVRANGDKGGSEAGTESDGASASQPQAAGKMKASLPASGPLHSQTGIAKTATSAKPTGPGVSKSARQPATSKTVPTKPTSGTASEVSASHSKSPSVPSGSTMKTAANQPTSSSKTSGESTASDAVKSGITTKRPVQAVASASKSPSGGTAKPANVSTPAGSSKPRGTAPEKRTAEKKMTDSVSDIDSDEETGSSQDASDSSLSPAPEETNIPIKTTPDVTIDDKLYATINDHLNPSVVESGVLRTVKHKHAKITQADMDEQYESGFAAAPFFKRMLGFDPTGMPLDHVLRKFIDENECRQADCSIHESSEPEGKSFKEFLDGFSMNTDVLQDIIQSDTQPGHASPQRQQLSTSGSSTTPCSTPKPVYGPEKPPGWTPNRQK